MVKTVTALPLAQGTSSNAAVQGLEPGTELKARVEANLPGGVIRLAAADARIDLRVPAPLPVGAEVTITVSGSKQQPAIQITTSGAAEPARPSGQLLQSQPGNLPGGASGQPATAVSSPIPRSDPALVHLVQTLGGSPQAAAGTAASSGAPSPAPVPAAPPAQQAAGVPQGTSTAAGQPAAAPTPGQGPTVPASGTNMSPTVPVPGASSQPVPAAGAPTVSTTPGVAPQAATPAGNAPAATPGNVLPAGGLVPAAGRPGASVPPGAASPSTAPQPPGTACSSAAAGSLRRAHIAFRRRRPGDFWTGNRTAARSAQPANPGTSLATGHPVPDPHRPGSSYRR
ncbi:hypothetical protein QW131_04515 [Roseibium salinum]|nr:hypothetical protein [Roseibium salinum]